MSWTPEVNWIASAGFGRLVYCAIQGSLLALAVSLGLRLMPRKSSRTVFVIWFVALVGTALLPLLAIWFSRPGEAQSSAAVFTLPASVAFFVFWGWMGFAAMGLVRVAVGVWQVSRLKRNARLLEIAGLDAQLHAAEKSKRRRAVSFLVSEQVQVPTAVGFIKPAVILPVWMVEEAAIDELKHVLLHELTHLQRRDDWTNLLQKIVKAVLFFNPGVWWMERELSLHREIACDDAVLAQTASPRTYAECLARVAEKSFLRRQMAMAQAAVSRMRQLTVRVARILDPNRAASTQIWKPAVPAVAALALISGISVAHAPELVRVDDGIANIAATHASGSAKSGDAVVAASMPVGNVRAWTASSQNRVEKPRVAAKPGVAIAKHSGAEWKPGTAGPKATQVRAKHDPRSPQILASYERPAPAGSASTEQKDFVVIVETRQTVTAAADGWHVSVQQVRWLVPVQRVQKPIPGKI